MHTYFRAMLFQRVDVQQSLSFMVLSLVLRTQTRVESGQA